MCTPPLIFNKQANMSPWLCYCCWEAEGDLEPSTTDHQHTISLCVGACQLRRLPAQAAQASQHGPLND